MKHRLPDGRWLMASQTDIQDFFRAHAIIGRKIADLLPSRLDYGIKNLDELDCIEGSTLECGICTDGYICIVFADGNHVEIEFSGEGPVIVSFNQANLKELPNPTGKIYPLRSVFPHCLGKRIEDILLDCGGEMRFPCYKGIDMSAEEYPVWRIRFILEDETVLSMKGWFDYFEVTHVRADGTYIEFPFPNI